MQFGLKIGTFKPNLVEAGTNGPKKLAVFAWYNSRFIWREGQIMLSGRETQRTLQLCVKSHFLPKQFTAAVIWGHKNSAYGVTWLGGNVAKAEKLIERGKHTNMYPLICPKHYLSNPPLSPLTKFTPPQQARLYWYGQICLKFLCPKFDLFQ